LLVAQSPQVIAQAKQSGDLLEALIVHKGKQLKPEEAGSLLITALEFDLKTTPSLTKGGKGLRDSALTIGMQLDAKSSRQLYLASLILKHCYMVTVEKCNSRVLWLVTFLLKLSVINPAIEFLPPLTHTLRFTSSVLNSAEPSPELEEIGGLINTLIEIERSSQDVIVAIDCIKNPQFLPKSPLLPYSILTLE